ncbi:MAG: DEAD/DEAH box helicase, partial [Desulfovibrionaceae bacterium]|nr:DEAD/DEAH box helicase [Desulfovibrionaceae bacterium]
MLADYITSLLKTPRFARQVTCHRIIEGQEAKYAELTRPLPPALSRLLELGGLSSLYTHQAQAIDRIRAGRDVVVTTPTASGKSLIYNLPVIERFLLDPDARALYLFPLKALAQDQKKALEKLVSP